MTQDRMPSAPAQSARRRLLKGSVCVPTVMTLASGSALAGASSIRCFNNAPMNADPASAAIKGLQRYSVSGPEYMIKRTELVSLAALDGFVLGTFFTNTSTPYVKLDGTGYTPGTTPATDTGFFIGLRYTYVPAAPTGQRFVATGLTKGTTSGQYGGSGQIMYGSCWTSCSPLK